MISTYPFVSGKYLIGGEWIQAEKTADVINPANLNEVIGEVALCSQTQVDEAIETAERAYKSWSKSEVEDRAKRMHEAAKELEHIVEENVTLFVRENGKALIEAKKICFAV